MIPQDTLKQIEQWPVEHCSVALLDGEDTLTLGDQHRVYELASVTKLLAAYAVLIAVEEGAFELDSPLGPPGSTVRHLLSHASGVGFKTREAEREVAERRIYSSAGFEILAEEIEKQTGMSFSQYFREAVAEPLGMNATEIWGSAGHSARSTVHDLVLFARELHAPQLLHSSTVKEAFTPQFSELRGIVPGYGSHRPCPWGLGFEIKGSKSPHWTGPSMPPETVGHFGMAGTFLWFIPQTGQAMIALTDRDFGDWAKPLWSDANEAVWQALQAN